MERRRFLSLSDDLKLQSSLPVLDFSQLLHNSRLAHAFSCAAYAKRPDFVHQRRRPSLRHCAAPSQFRFLGSLRSKFIPPAITLFSLIVVQEDCAPYPGRLFVGGWGDKKKKKNQEALNCYSRCILEWAAAPAATNCFPLLKVSWKINPTDPTVGPLFFPTDRERQCE